MPLTRRDFLAGSAVAAIAGAMGRPAFARAWRTQPAAQAATAQPVFTPIRRNVGFFTMRGGTIGYLIDPAAVVVVDSQFAAEGRACLDGVNERSNRRPVDFLINTHHHGDHTGGNISFKGAAVHVVAHEQAAEHMRNPPGRPAPTAEQLYPDTTFAVTWAAAAGGERVSAKWYGRAHTSGDAVVTFERANVAHMGDLMFNQRHPVVDRAAGATIRNWAAILDRVPRDHANDTLYIFGHAGAGLPVTGDRSDLGRFRDYLGGLLAFVEAQIKAGRTRDEILLLRDPLKGFETFGRFGAPGPTDALTVAYEELTAGS